MLTFGQSRERVWARAGAEDTVVHGALERGARLVRVEREGDGVRGDHSGRSAGDGGLRLDRVDGPAPAAIGPVLPAGSVARRRTCPGSSPRVTGEVQAVNGPPSRRHSVVAVESSTVQVILPSVADGARRTVGDGDVGAVVSTVTTRLAVGPVLPASLVARTWSVLGAFREVPRRRAARCTPRRRRRRRGSRRPPLR